MCGIVYSKSLVGKPVNKTILKRYIFQRSRGTDGFGFYNPQTNRLTHNPREGRILSLLRRDKKATEILFHHRMPTSTMNVRNACHPFSTKDYFKNNYIVVHNGVLWNENILKAEHEQRGIDYISEQEDGSFNDSEALAYDIARLIEGEVTHLKAEGSIAFIAIQRDKRGTPKAVYFGRNTGNPLVMKKTKASFTLSSEGDGEMIDPNTLYCYTYRTGEITQTPLHIPTSTRYYGGAYGYEGMGGGYWHGGEWYEDEEEFREMQQWNNSFSSPTPAETARYFEGQSAQDKIAATAVLNRLLDENYNDKQSALMSAYSEISDCEKVEDGLRHNVEVLGLASDDEVDKFYSVGDRKHLLKLACIVLEGGKSGQSQMGFRYTPDHETYTGKHNWADRDRARERIDPATGFAYYPYAE